MSLDVYLEMEGVTTLYPEDRIFIREGGSTKEISREEWNRRFPNREPFTIAGGVYEDGIVYTANITHNLNKMAAEAGIYKHLWRPDEVDIKKAEELIEPLTQGLIALGNEPGRYKALNPPNGWGTYEGLVEFVANYLAACKRYPEAVVRVWR